jgi:hypothetical protein
MKESDLLCVCVCVRVSVIVSPPSASIPTRFPPPFYMRWVFVEREISC